MTNVTRGELEQAQIINLSNNEAVSCMFNPHEYTLTKSNTWNLSESASQQSPKVEYQSSTGQTLSLKLYFDTANTREDVRTYTDKLWKMMQIDQNAAHSQSNKASPPEVAFKWGRFYFRSVITNMKQKFTLFNPNGVPIRCNVTLKLEQKIDIDDYQGQDSPLKAFGEAAINIAGDRVDNLLGDSTPPTSENIRDLMEANNIDNPLNIASGVVLSLAGGAAGSAAADASGNFNANANASINSDGDVNASGNFNASGNIRTNGNARATGSASANARANGSFRANGNIS